MRRAGTVKGGDGLMSAAAQTQAAAGKRPKGYDAVHQGLKQLYPPPGQTKDKPDMDIVLVPGLGAHPEESWKSAKTGWNWTTSEDGLVKEYPRARILLFMYESAWVGPLKVKNFMSNIAMTLLVALRSLREDCKTRPIVFIGHSMGGLVIAKAVCYADSRPDLFPVMFAATSATIFFGTPFGGADAASTAAMYAYFAEKIGQATASTLLDYMKPGDEALRELREEFTRLVGKLDRKIHVVCFWETEPTDFAQMARLPTLFGAARLILPKSTIMVAFESATLAVASQSQNIATNHRDLVKFHGPKDENWAQAVREHLKIALSHVHTNAKNRLSMARGLDWSVHKGIMDALGGVQVERKRKEIAKKVAASSWITEAGEYAEWVGKKKHGNPTHEAEVPIDCLWIRGREGRGKTGAAIAVINNIESSIKQNLNEEENPEQDETLLAYFFCDSSTDCSTAEDLLKSVLSQLITQQTALASHARVFNKTNKGKKDTARDLRDKVEGLQPTLENLWQSLQSMLSDELAGARVYFVINNLHALPAESESTVKLMSLLEGELGGVYTSDRSRGGWRVPTRWFITSREPHRVGNPLLGSSVVRLINLEDEKYGDKVQLELRRHAKARVAALEVQKKYNKALTYYASSLIGKRARSTHWIDVTCVQLEQLPEEESQLKIRRKLESTPQDLSELLNEAWRLIFASTEDSGEEIKEMLRALILTFEEPTVPELEVLAGLGSAEDVSNNKLHVLIDKCKPLLVVKKTIGFMNAAVKTHLYRNAEKLLGLSEEAIRWHHGVLALQCLAHLKEKLGFPETHVEDLSATDDVPDDDEDENSVAPSIADAEPSPWGFPPSGAAPSGLPPTGIPAPESQQGVDTQGEQDGDEDSEADGSSSDEEYDWEQDSEEEMDPESEILKDLAYAYPVKHWLHHGGKATVEFADDLSQDEFWQTNSLVRRRWLVEYMRMTSDFDFNVFEPRTLTPLHVAASIGFRQLVVSLFNNGHEEELHTYDSLQFKPLHLAAALGRCNIVDELITMGTLVDDAEGPNGDTPLHMASEGGHVAVMKKLLDRGADPNKYSQFSGLVISVAISSGKIGAVELLAAQKGFVLLPERDDIESPLVQAAAMSDISMFEYLLDKFKSSIPTEEYGKALASAAGAGRIDIFDRLLRREYSHQDFQYALQCATENSKWDIINIILETCGGLNCDDTFVQAAADPESKNDFLDRLWAYTRGAISQYKLNESLYHATDREKIDTVAVLLQKYRADANATGPEYGNALTAAAFDGRLDIVKLLLSHGAVIDNPDGWPLQAAAQQGHLDVVQELLARGADVNSLSPNFPGGTAIQAATESGQRDIVELLLDCKADPNLGAGEYSPPIVAAASYCQPAILDLLVDHRAEVNVWTSGEERTTPLIEAAGYIPGTDSLRKLLNAGANINAVNAEGETALIAAASAGDEEVVEFLLAQGADILLTTHEGKNALKAAIESDDDVDASECIRVLVEHVSMILSCLETAMRSGNAAVIAVMRTAMAKPQALNYDDEGSSPTNGEVHCEQVSYHGNVGAGVPITIAALPASTPKPPPFADAQSTTTQRVSWEQQQPQPYIQASTLAPQQRQQAIEMPKMPDHYSPVHPYQTPNPGSQPLTYAQQPTPRAAIERRPVGVAGGVSSEYSTSRSASSERNNADQAPLGQYRAYALGTRDPAPTSVAAANLPPPPPPRPVVGPTPPQLPRRPFEATSQATVTTYQDISLYDGSHWGGLGQTPDSNTRNGVTAVPYHQRTCSSPPRPSIPSHSYSSPSGPPAQMMVHQAPPTQTQWPAQSTYVTTPQMNPGQAQYVNQGQQRLYNAYQTRS